MLLGFLVWLQIFTLTPEAGVVSELRQYDKDSIGVTLVVLGTLQDGGAPHAGCMKPCCADLYERPDPLRQVVSLGVADGTTGKNYLFEATPDISRQLLALSRIHQKTGRLVPDGIFLTHAHIGHYSGLMHLGKESLDARGVPVYAMPRMRNFLVKNGPWAQLIERKNIVLEPLEDGQPVRLSDELTILPVTVPHRDEYSETVGFYISGREKTALFIPDIDKWSRWKRDIVEEIRKVDYAFLDATFFDGAEIGRRDLAEIPHPFVVESLKVFEVLTPEERSKVFFIHLNHTNPLLDPESEASQLVKKDGFGVARIGDSFEL